MNQLDLSHLNQSRFVVGVPKEINRLAAGSSVNDFSVFGDITIVTTTNWTSTGRFGDLHDFNQSTKSGFAIRNFETAIGSWINGKGTSFHIKITGEYPIPANYIPDFPPDIYGQQ